MKLRMGLVAAAAACLLVTAASVLAAGGGNNADPDADYDRLDGTGRSGKTVNVIEWEGNLEVHVYPAGSLSGLALKLDKRNKEKPVMVIGYRFNNDPETQLIRRAILTIPMSEGFKAWRDKSAKDYDKVVISNSRLSGKEYIAFTLEAEPRQLYPDGHPALGQPKVAEKHESESRRPASRGGSARGRERAAPRNDVDAESGTIRPFGM
jgi:hypothetical protein